MFATSRPTRAYQGCDKRPSYLDKIRTTQYANGFQCSANPNSETLFALSKDYDGGSPHASYASKNEVDSDFWLTPDPIFSRPVLTISTNNDPSKVTITVNTKRPL